MLLCDYPEVRERWFEFEGARRREWAREWLEGLGVEATEAEEDGNPGGLARPTPRPAH